MKIVFVILQYMACNDTLECVDSIRNHVDTGDYKIIIVDNCSPDDSYARVRSAYKSSKDIILLQSDENLGFARGNNIGYRYALENLDPEYIVMLNNDVLLIQDNIYAILSDCHARHGFAVMGPLIFTADGNYTSSPMIADGKDIPDYMPASKEFMQATIKDFKFKLLLIKLHIYRPIRFLYKKFLGKPATRGGSLYFEEHINCRLHGAFMAFSKDYMSIFPHGLDDRTFMYDEEYFLQYHVINACLKLLYSPKYSVYHKEDASTSAMLHTYVKKAKFQMKWMVNSRNLYIEMLEQDEDSCLPKHGEQL